MTFGGGADDLLELAKLLPVFARTRWKGQDERQRLSEDDHARLLAWVTRAEPILPGSVRSGLQPRLDAWNATHPEDPWTEQRLVEADACIVVGLRVAWFWRGGLGVPKELRGDGAALVGPVDGVDEALLSRRFRSVARVGAQFIASEAGGLEQEGWAESLARVIVNGPDDLERAWLKSLALGADWRFLELLTPIERAALRGRLRDRLAAHAEHLDFASDAELAGFSEHGAAVRTQTPSPRLLRHARVALRAWAERERWTNLTWSRFGDDMPQLWATAAVSLSANADDAMNTLLALPHGETLWHAAQWVAMHRPTYIASLLRFPASRWLAALLIAGLPLEHHDPMMTRPIDLTEEWVDVQTRLRRWLLRTPTEWDVELACELLASDVGRPTRTNRAVDSAPPKIDRQTPWIQAARLDANGLLARVSAWLAATGQDDENAVLAVIEVVAGCQEAKVAPTLSQPLALLVATRYALAVAMSGAHSRVPALGSIASGGAAWCDVLATGAEHLDVFLGKPQLKAMYETATRSKEVRDAVECVFQAKAHLRNMALLALDAGSVAAEALCTSSIELLEDDAGSTLPSKILSYEFGHDGDLHGGPTLACLGLAVSRLQALGLRLTRRLIRAGVDRVLLALFASEMPVSSEPRRRVEEALEDVPLGDNKGIGHYNAVARSMIALGRWRDAEQAARFALNIVKVRSRSDLRDLATEAADLLLTALLGEHRYAEIIAFDAQSAGAQDDGGLRLHRARAMYWTGRKADALRLMKHPGGCGHAEPRACLFRAEIQLRENELDEALETLGETQRVFGDRTPTWAGLLEALTWFEKRDYVRTATLVSQLSPDVAKMPGAVFLRARLLMETTPGVEALRRDLDGLATIDPELATSLRQRLAVIPPMWLGIGSGAPESGRAAVGFDQWLKFFGEERNTTDYLIGLFADSLAYMANRPYRLARGGDAPDEDAFTDRLVDRIERLLDLFGAVVRVRDGFGFAKKKTGVPDLLVCERAHHAPLCLAEAKIWTDSHGPGSFKSALTQMVGYDYTGDALVRVLLVYVREERDGALVEACDKITTLLRGAPAGIACDGAPEVLETARHSRVARVLRSQHRRPNHDAAQPIYTIVAHLKIDRPA